MPCIVQQLDSSAAEALVGAHASAAITKTSPTTGKREKVRARIGLLVNDVAVHWGERSQQPILCAKWYFSGIQCFLQFFN